MRNLEESINLTAWLGCNIEQAFKMFTNKKEIQSWLPMVANVIPKEGGKYEISWSLTNNNRKEAMSNNIFICKILAYEPNKYIAFEWWDPSDQSSSDSSEPNTQIEIQFLPMDLNGKDDVEFTEVHLTLTSCKDSEHDKEVRESFESTWANSFEKLIEHVNDIY